MRVQADHREQWDSSYRNRDNYLFYPNEEVVRFFSRYVRKRVGREKFRAVSDIHRVLCLGCGIGRHVFFCDDMQREAWGIDLSHEALKEARGLAEHLGRPHLGDRFLQCSGSALPFADDQFGATISHGVLDSMPFELARSVMREVQRVTDPGGVFYLDLISGDDSDHAREFNGEITVESAHEQGTVQSYFNFGKIEGLIADSGFTLEECLLVQREDVTRGGRKGRYHLVLRK